jgi:hypothetical protein
MNKEQEQKYEYKYKKMRRIQKVLSKPDDQERVMSIRYHKRLKSKKALRAKEAKYLAIILRGIGIFLAIGTFFLWCWRYNMFPMSLFGIICGVVVAGILKIIYPNGLDSSVKIPKYVGLTFFCVAILLIFNRFTFGFGFMFLSSLISAGYLVGVIKFLPISTS